MSGNPRKKDRTGPEYQLGRRRYTRVPGYHSVLPRVFPFRSQLSREAVAGLIEELQAVEREGYAVTSHPSSLDGHVHLWLSADSAEYLVSVMPSLHGRLEKTG